MHGSKAHLGPVEAVAERGDAREDLEGGLAKGLDDRAAQLEQQVALHARTQAAYCSVLLQPSLSHASCMQDAPCLHTVTSRAEGAMMAAHQEHHGQKLQTFRRNGKVQNNGNQLHHKSG